MGWFRCFNRAAGGVGGFKHVDRSNQHEPWPSQIRASNRAPPFQFAATQSGEEKGEGDKDGGLPRLQTVRVFGVHRLVFVGHFGLMVQQRIHTRCVQVTQDPREFGFSKEDVARALGFLRSLMESRRFRAEVRLLCVVWVGGEMERGSKQCLFDVSSSTHQNR